MHELRQLRADIDALAARAAGGERSHELARAMEDLLCDGYAACLQVDSRVRRLQRRRGELTALGHDGEPNDDLRGLDERRDRLERSAIEARRELAALRERFVRIGGMQATAR